MRVSKLAGSLRHQHDPGSTADQAEAPVIVHLLYQKAVDLRICLILSQLGFKVKPLSTIAAFHRSRSKSGLVVVDVDADLARGAEIVEELVARHRHSLVVCLCAGGSIEFFRRCFRMGVIDILDKSFDNQRVLEAFSSIRAFGSRRLPLSAALRQRQVRYASLTRKEREVFRYLLEGMTNRDIAGLLTLSRRTVEVHRAHIQKKLQVRNTTQMACEYSELVRGMELHERTLNGLARNTG